MKLPVRSRRLVGGATQDHRHSASNTGRMNTPRTAAAALLMLPLVAALATPTPTPAAAAAGFGPPKAVPTLGAGCVLRVMPAQVPPARGFGICRHQTGDGADQYDRLAYFESTGDGWHGRQLSFYGRPQAVAQDETGTYLLAEVHAPTHAQGPAIIHRDTHGTYSWRYLGPAGAVSGAGLVAAHGKWWAVWGCDNDATGASHLCEAGTLFGNTAPRAITSGADRDALPSLVLVSGSNMRLVWTRVRQLTSSEDVDVRTASSAGRGWTSSSLATGHHDMVGSLAADGGHSFVSWVQDSRPVIASDESGTWQRRVLRSRSCARGAVVTASQGHVLLGVTQCSTGDDPSGTQAGTAVLAYERSAGSWSSSTLSRSDSDGPVVLTGISIAGRATLAFQSAGAGSTFTRSQ
jgi:hypothetical protein